MRQRELDAVARSVEVLRDHDELVAAEAAHGVGRAQAVAQPLRDLHEQAIAGVVAEAVVDDLHPVEVDVEDGELGAGASRARDGVLEPVEEQPAVRELRERVVRRLHHERALHVLELRDVARDA